MEIPSPSVQVLKAAYELGYAARCLSPPEVDKLWQNIVREFANSPVGVLWHHLKETTSVHRADGWMALDEYLVHTPFILFFDRSQDLAMIEFSIGTRLSRILEQCTGFEFYLTDRESTYVVCFNDHDCLISSGKATEWKLFA